MSCSTRLTSSEAEAVLALPAALPPVQLLSQPAAPSRIVAASAALTSFVFMVVPPLRVEEGEGRALRAGFGKPARAGGTALAPPPRRPYVTGTDAARDGRDGPSAPLPSRALKP